MRPHRKYPFVIIISILSLIVFSNDSSAQMKPISLKGCMRYLDRHLNDTFKYDFKVSPFDYCYFKHGFGMGFRNGMGLWKTNLLTIHFRLRGIRHPDDMSAIIKKSFHRYLNNEPIKFREQKKKYKTYWSEIDKGKDSGEVYSELWEKNAIPDSILKTEYLELFYIGRKVVGEFMVTKWISDRTSEGRDIEYIGKVIAASDSLIEISIISVGQIEDEFEFTDMLLKTEPKPGETIDVIPCNLYLIPDE